MTRTAAGYDAAVARVTDLEGRIVRTLEYVDSLLRLPGLNKQLGEVLVAVHNSLNTPADSGPCCAQIAKTGVCYCHEDDRG